MMRPRLFAAGALLAVLSISLQAQATQNQSQAALPVSPVSFGGMLQVLLGLALVLAAVAASAWLLRRFSPGQVGAGGVIRIVGGIAVGPKERVVLVEVGETWLVLGVAPGQVTTLHTLPRLEGVAAAQPTGDGQPGFPVWLKEIVNRRKPDEGRQAHERE